MRESEKSRRPRLKPEAPRGMDEKIGQDARRLLEILPKIAAIYESYGFAPLETGILEYAETIGSFLPDQERPNAGVFSFRDEDEKEWLALRYDLTAPLARYAARHYETLPKPFRRYQWGYVFRNEKPEPGRTRQFLQMDADTIGSASAAADAEMCMMMADIMEAVGLKRGQYAVSVSSRKILDGVMDAAGVAAEDAETRGRVFRSIDKYDRLGGKEVRKLLGAGREDPSGDFTKGAGLSEKQIAWIMECFRDGEKDFFPKMRSLVGESARGEEGLRELQEMASLLAKLNYGEDRVVFDSSIVRGLAYYTGAVFEVLMEDKKSAIKSALAGGGRYDDLLSRFRSEPVPATGMSIGINRLLLKLQEKEKRQAPIIILAMEKTRMAEYQKIAADLRKAGMAAEAYLGSGGMKQQLKYADKREALFVVIEGEDERAKRKITIKDMKLGRQRSETIADNLAWRQGASAQETIGREKLVSWLKDAMKPRK